MLFNWTTLESIWVMLAFLVGTVYGLISGYKLRDIRDETEHEKFDAKFYKILEKAINSKVISWWYSK